MRFSRPVILCAALLAVLSGLSAISQTGGSGTAQIVSACGTPPSTYVPGTVRPLTMDTTGTLCTPGAGGASIGVNIHASNGDNLTDTANALDINVKSSGISNQTVVIGPSASAGSAIAPGVGGSAASNIVLKAGGGNLYSVYFTAGTTQGWGMVFNATSKPTDGATTSGIASGNLQDCIYVPANSTQSVNYSPGPLELFSTGITAVFSSTGCGTLTASATAYIHGSAQ